MSFFLFLISLVVFTARADEPFNYESLVALIQKHDIRNVEDLLAKLPLEIRENYTLVYESGSQQKASKLNPRVLLFGKDAEMVLAFSGGGTDAKANAIEVAQFRSISSQIELREVRFPSAINESVHFSTKNPKECAACHQDRPKYLFSEYNIWPGMFGSDDDSLDQTDGEKKAFDDFVALARLHPRYRHLEKLGTGPQKSYPYYLGPVRYSETVGEAENEHRRFENQPNTRFTIFLLRRLALRSQEKVLANPFFRKYQDALFFLYLNCATSQSSKIKEEVRQDFERLFPKKATTPELAAEPALNLLFGVLGLDDSEAGLEKSSAPKDPGTYLRDDDGFTNHSRMLVALLSEKAEMKFPMKTLAKNAAGFGEMETLKRMDALAPLEIDKKQASASCEELGKKALQAFEDFKKPGVPRGPKGNRAH